jgi:hypothetical protein
MKILFDPVYTARPSRCSTAFSMFEMIKDIAKARDDAFFYVLYPPSAQEDQEDWAFLRQMPDRVTLLPMAQTTGARVSELYSLSDTLRHYLRPWATECWDADVVISSRIPVLPHMRSHASQAFGVTGTYYNRMYIGLEEMPALPYRKTIPWSKVLYQTTVAAYASADAILVAHQWMKANLRKVLKETMTPSWTMEVLAKIHECVPVKLERLKLKASGYTEGPFKISIVGRASATSRFEMSAELLRKHFSFPLGKNKQAMEFIATTNSGMGGSDFGDLDFLDVQFNSREKFYELLSGLHVAVTMTPVEDFSMTVYETLRAGVPLVMLKADWNSFLGDSYPFFVSSQVEAYAMINWLAGNYDEAYAKFAEWEATYWASYVQSERNVSTSTKALQLIAAYEQTAGEDMDGKAVTYRERIAELGASLPEGELLKLEHLIAGAGLPMVSAAQEDPASQQLISRYPNTIILKRVALELGWKETNVCGHYTR